MSAIYDDFTRELVVLRERYRGRPRDEMLRLWLLALEREQIVAVAYAQDRLQARIEELPDEARPIAAAALAWAWRDEEMHAVFIRGALLRLGSRWLLARALMQQLAGGVAGWATAVLQHAPRGSVWFARAAARTIALLGILTGKVPRAMRGELAYRNFREFCAANVDAERTAAACWRRLEELGEGDAGAYHAMAEDERRHEELFAALGSTFDERGRFAPGEGLGSLRRRIAAVGPAFLGGGQRAPLGPVLCLTGADKRALLRAALKECGLPACAGKRVAVKTSFMLGYSRKDASPIIDPDLLDELSRAVREQGAIDVAVIDGPNVYDRFFRNRSVESVARYLDLASPHYRIVDASLDQMPHRFARGLGQSTVCRTWADAEVRIDFAKLRSHPCSQAILSLKNLEGLGERSDEYVFLERQADRATPVLMVLDAFPPHLALIDAYEKVPDGLAGMMGCPSPRTPRRLYASRDLIALDLVVARHLGITDLRETVLPVACHWFGTPGPTIEVRGLDQPVAPWTGPYSSNVNAFLSFWANPVYSLWSGRGELFTPEMDEEAFPPSRRLGLLRRWLRRGLQALLGLRLPA